MKKIGGVYTSGQKDWQKKYENGNDKKSRQKYVNHEIYDKMAYLLKNMILVCGYLRFRQLKREKKGSVVFKHNANLTVSVVSA